MRAIFSSTAQLMANTLYQSYAKGASLNENFDSPNTGYMVSVFAGPVYDSALDVNPLEVARFIREEYPEYRTDDDSTYVGVWTDSQTGKIYFDISINFTEEDGGKASAITIAKTFKQLAIWDIDNNCEIRV